MSKNKQMHSEIIMTVGPERSTSGPASLAQGVYGARGNLELVACDAADGLWVFWFNADGPDDPQETPDVPPGRWSSGLAFARGHRYLDAQIAQSTLGPDHLEVAALREDGVLESWYWSPGPGFQQRDADVAASVSRFRLSHSDGVLTVDVHHLDGSTAVVSSGAAGYPGRTWTARPGSATVDDPRALEALHTRGITPLPGTARSTTSTRDGGTLELTWRDPSGHIHHLPLPLPLPLPR